MKIFISFAVAIAAYVFFWYASFCNHEFSMLLALISFWGCCITLYTRQRTKRQDDPSAENQDRS